MRRIAFAVSASKAAGMTSFANSDFEPPFTIGFRRRFTKACQSRPAKSDSAGHDSTMDRRDRGASAASSHRDRYDDDRPDAAWDDAHWDDDRDAPRRPRRSLFGRGFALVKLAVFALPVALFMYGSFADCSGRPAGAGWLGLLGAGACARSEMIGSVLSMQDNFALLKRMID